MVTQNLMTTLQIFLLALFALYACKENSNPVSSGGFPVEAGPILFISDKSGSYQLYSMNEDGSNVQQLTNDPNFQICDAKWSPDGEKIVYTQYDANDWSYDNGVLWIINISTGAEHQLTFNIYEKIVISKEVIRYEMRDKQTPAVLVPQRGYTTKTQNQ